MPTIVIHCQVNIVLLGAGEALARFCGPGDIAIVAARDGWWIRFVNTDGSIDDYDEPYSSYQEALWAAKAAAEFGLD
ncbi:MAG: hypothetical protein V4463_24415 [Pseudomonadota bacterium]